ncbi:MAG: diguanylate cyclase [Oscillospiraceae bacterium]
MKQFQFNYHSKASLKKELSKIKQWCQLHITSKTIFHIFSNSIDEDLISDICDTIVKEIPNSLYMGCSTNGNILYGVLSSTDISIVCTICEFPSTQAEVLQYQLTNETIVPVVDDLLEKIQERPWVKSIDMLVTIRGMSMTPFCEALQQIPEGIEIFGGGAFNSDMNDDRSCVFTSSGKYSNNGVAFLLLGGDDYHVTTTHVTGWKPLGRTFHVTRAEGSTLYELDNRPAYHIYQKYLNIRNNEHFFENTLEFPFFYEHGGINLLRAPVSSNPDGSIIMTADMEEDVVAHLAYGDPLTILQSVYSVGSEIGEFQPEAVRIYSCAARRTFWGVKEISKETAPFQTVAPTSGFYTSGEFLRTNGYMNQHNVTLVVAAAREGSLDPQKENHFHSSDDDFTGKVSLISRLATFIEASTRELEQANEQLAFVAVSDGLTKLFNRAEIQRRIKEQLISGKSLSLVMLDIDNFKHVNDTFGHKEGDNVIVGLSDLLRNGIAKYCPKASAGRWGGEEFMLLLPYDLTLAEGAASHILEDFSAIAFPEAGHQTVSIGVTTVIEGENLDTLLVRVDKALYEAKRTGKNRFVVL